MRSARRGTAWTMAVALAFATLAAGAAAGDPPKMEALWADLEKDEPESLQALLAMSARPDETVAFLAKTMKPLKIEPQAAMDLIVKLESRDEEVWRPAFEELEYFDPRLALKLEDILKDINIDPARGRLVEILSGRKPGTFAGKEIELKWIAEQFIFSSGGGSWGAAARVEQIGTSDWLGRKRKWVRCARGLVLLEHIGTPAAREILDRMATGHADASPTKAAKAAIARLTSKAG